MSPSSRRCPISKHAAERPDTLALVAPQETWTYAAFDEAVRRTVVRFRDSGVSAGTRMALYGRQSEAQITVLAALARIGAVVAPLSHRLPTKRILAACERIDADGICTSERKLEEAARQSDLPVWSIPDQIAAPDSLERTASDAASTSDEAHIRLDRPATLIFTSGSSGAPKAALHTWGHHRASAQGSATNVPLAPGDRWLLSLPLYHVGGLAILVRCARAGATVVVPSPQASLADALARHAITHVSLVPTQLRRVLRVTNTPPPSLKGVLLGGAALPPDLISDALDAGWPLHTTYGCTEMASQIATTPPGAHRDTLLHTAGSVLSHVELRIAPNREILVRGASLFSGYVTDSGLDPARTDDGWYRTGDIGGLDDAGHLHVKGRADRMFISGGENIHPEEVEAALQRLDDVAHAVVVPVPDPEFGQRPVAFVQMDSAPPVLPQLRHALDALLPRFKHPVALFPFPAPAVDGAMKFSYHDLEKEARNLLRE